MNNPQTAAETLQTVFERIHRKQMAGLPLLNPALQVQTLGFQVYAGRVIGIVITPWMMNLVMLPGDEDDWGNLKIGKKQTHKFPAKTHKFMVNEIDGIGLCQTCSLYSPMHEFVNQAHAVAAAQSFLDILMTEAQSDAEDPVDEELLGRIMRGEETPGVDLAEIDDGVLMETAAHPVRGHSVRRVRVAK